MAWKKILLVNILLAALFASSTIVWAEVNALEIPWWTVDGGGGTSGSGNYTLSGTIGQSDPGDLVGGSYTLHGGFWVGLPIPIEGYTTHLPLIMKTP